MQLTAGLHGRVLDLQIGAEVPAFRGAHICVLGFLVLCGSLTVHGNGLGGCRALSVVRGVTAALCGNAQVVACLTGLQLLGNVDLNIEGAVRVQRVKPLGGVRFAGIGNQQSPCGGVSALTIIPQVLINGTMTTGARVLGGLAILQVVQLQRYGGAALALGVRPAAAFNT